ncbi:hypothetical protein GCM10028774_62420 [Spirosoma jeollabukense]
MDGLVARVDEFMRENNGPEIDTIYVSRRLIGMFRYLFCEEYPVQKISYVCQGWGKPGVEKHERMRCIGKGMHI